jgi:hypothetical protein
VTEIPEQIARDTLVELGETPGNDPIAQLAAYAETSSALLQDLRERMYLTHQPPTDLDEYGRVRDNTTSARIALVRIHAAQETAQLEAILELPDARREPDEDTE